MINPIIAIRNLMTPIQDQKSAMQDQKLIMQDQIKITNRQMRVTIAQLNTDQMKVTKDQLRGTMDHLEKKTMTAQTNPGITMVFPPPYQQLIRFLKLTMASQSTELRNLLCKSRLFLLVPMVFHRAVFYHSLTPALAFPLYLNLVSLPLLAEMILLTTEVTLTQLVKGII
jgi:hypothetical protein